MALEAHHVHGIPELGDPVLHPRGGTVACAVVFPGEPDGRSVIVLFQGGEVWERGATDGEGASLHGHTALAWSPRGEELAFVARSDEGIYKLLSLEGDRVRTMLTSEDPLSHLAWSPSGSKMLYLRHSGQPRDSTLWLLDIRDGAATRVTPPGQFVSRASWSPDGQSLMVLIAPSCQADVVEYQSVLRRVDLLSGAEETLVNRINTYITPRLSPDGRSLLMVEPEAPFLERGALVILDMQSGLRLRLPSALAENAWGAWWAGAEELMIGTAQGTAMRMVRWSLSGGRALEEIDLCLPVSPYWREIWSSTPHGEEGVYLSGAPTRPLEIWRHRRGRGEERVSSLSDNMPEAATLVERVEWEGEAGVVEGVLIRPEGRRGPLPLVVRVHGGPAYHYGLGFASTFGYWIVGLNAHVMAGQGMAVLLPNHRGSSGSGLAFAAALSSGFFGTPALADVVAGVDALSQRGIVDPARVGIMGWSYGGYLTALAMGLRGTFQAGVAGGGVYDLPVMFERADQPQFYRIYLGGSPQERESWYRDQSPITWASRIKAPLLMLHGDADVRCPLLQAQAMEEALRASGVEVELRLYKGEGHQIEGLRNKIDADESALALMRRALAVAEPSQKP